MVATWVLILIYTHNERGWSELATAEFYSRSACESAAQVFLDRAPGRERAFCVPTGAEQN